MYELDREEFLTVEAKEGDRGALALLYDGLFPGIYAYTRMRMPTTADAEDIVSETFLAVVNGLAKFQWSWPGSFRAWAFQIARNHIADFYRRDGRRQEDPAMDRPGSVFTEASALEDVAIQNESLQLLLTKIEAMSPRRREVLLLRYFGGLRNREIASTLSLDERTVSAYLSRALAELQADFYAIHEADVR
jgi:RNA polymerase sigma-70 factor (ECF subfamily)